MNSVAARRPEQRLYDVYLARVIKSQSVQCHRAAVTGDDKLPPWVFFSAGCRPKLTGSFLWSLDAPEKDFPGGAIRLAPKSHFAPYAIGLGRGGRGL